MTSLAPILSLVWPYVRYPGMRGSATPLPCADIQVKVAAPVTEQNVVLDLGLVAVFDWRAAETLVDLVASHKQSGRSIRIINVSTTTKAILHALGHLSELLQYMS